MVFSKNCCIYFLVLHECYEISPFAFVFPDHLRHPVFNACSCRKVKKQTIANCICLWKSPLVLFYYPFLSYSYHDGRTDVFTRLLMATNRFCFRDFWKAQGSTERCRTLGYLFNLDRCSDNAV